MPLKKETKSNAVTPADIFCCQKCGDCCQGYGGTYLTDHDVQAIAKYIKSTPDKFIENCCAFSGGKPVLVQAESGYCIFWDKLCTIHPVKPRMCKAWPFIDSVLIDADNWETMSSLCPGIRTDFAASDIQRCVKQKLIQKT